MQDKNPAVNLPDAILRQQEVIASILRNSVSVMSLTQIQQHQIFSPQLATVVYKLAQINAQFNERFSQIIPRITNVVRPQLGPVVELVKRVGEASAIRDAFLHYNLWIAPSMNEAFISKVLDSHKRGLSSATVHSMLVRHYAGNNWKALDGIVERCKKNPLFKRRLQLIDEALETHRLGFYNSSVLLLLVQLEGIAADYVKKHKLMPQLGGKTKEIILAAVQSTPCSLSDVREYAGISALIGYLQQSMYISMDFDKEHGRLQTEEHLLAHPIRHGRQVKFGTRANSLRLFLILDVLSLLDT